MRAKVDINENMITWAIARAGYDLHKFLLSSPKIKDWVDKKKQPTIKQLEKFSHKVHIPFGYLFLQKPPEEILPIPFFRTENSNESVSLNVYDTIQLIQRRQVWLKNYLKDNDYKKLNFVGKYNNKSDIGEIALDISRTLGLDESWARDFQTWEKALDYLSQKVEERGIILTFNSVVENNNSRQIDVNDCRGFVLVDDIVPFMFVNSADGKAAQMFTIVHELAHIWVGESAGFDFRQLQPANDPTKKLCDKVAAEFLVPELQFKVAWRKQQNFIRLAREFKVSPIVIARRSLDLGYITKTDFFGFYNAYITEVKIKK